MGKDIEVLKENDTVFVNYKGRCIFIKIGDIRLIESELNYVKIFFKKDYVVIHKSLNQMEQRLDNDIFFRANRKQIININMIEKTDVEADRYLYVYIKGGEKIYLSRRQSMNVKRF